MDRSPGKRLCAALTKESPLQIMGTPNAYSALMATDVGFHALYLSGAGVANGAYALPDVGVTTLDNVLEEARRITGAVDTPLLVDIDTGWGGAPMIERAIQEMIRAGVAGVHIEDQGNSKLCGHLPEKRLVSIPEMKSRIEAAVRARTDPDFVIMARTDALSVEGLDQALERAIEYKKSGADMLFLEAATTLNQYQTCKEIVQLPLLANMTEFGKTPLWTVQDLRASGVDMVLYPLSAFRAMNLAALNVFQEIKQTGTQSHLTSRMQTREELYSFLNYTPPRSP